MIEYTVLHPDECGKCACEIGDVAETHKSGETPPCQPGVEQRAVLCNGELPFRLAAPFAVFFPGLLMVLFIHRHRDVPVE